MKKLILTAALCACVAGLGDAIAAPGRVAAAAAITAPGRAVDAIAAPGCTASVPASTPTATQRGTQIVERLAAWFGAMPAYRVDFTVGEGDQIVRGNYAVSGQSYYIAVDDTAEVFGDGKTRYEVDNRRREVTLVGVDPASRNLLDNPVHAFDFLGSQYDAVLVWERDGRAAVLLTPAQEAASAIGSVTLTLSTTTMRPESLVYDYDGEQVAILVDGVAPLTTPLKTFDKARYAGYETIDFR